MTQYGWGAAIHTAAGALGDPPPPMWYEWTVEGTPFYSYYPPRAFGKLVLAGGLVQAYKNGGPSQVYGPVPVGLSPGLGAASGTSPTAPSQSSQSSRQGRESSEPGKHGVSRQSSQRRDRARRKSCPQGHYWSYKEKKCVKSKFN